MTGEITAKKDRDPIFTVCLVIFLIAAVIALGIFVANEFVPSGDKTASTGDTVTVDYVGTFYGEYGTDIAVVFDTNISSIGNDDDIQKSNDWTKKSSYADLTFKIGGGTMLEGFEKAVIGHKVGDTIKVYLTAAEAYYGPSTERTMSTVGNEIASTHTMSEDEFSDLYPNITLKPGQITYFESVYKFPAQAIMSDSGRNVTITYFPVAGESYEVYKSGDTTVNLKASSVGETITFDIIINNPVKVGDNGAIQMIKLALEDDIYIKAINGTEITYKTGTETLNEPLYFEIKLKEIA